MLRPILAALAAASLTFSAAALAQSSADPGTQAKPGQTSAKAAKDAKKTADRQKAKACYDACYKKGVAEKKHFLPKSTDLECRNKCKFTPI